MSSPKPEPSTRCTPSSSGKHEPASSRSCSPHVPLYERTGRFRIYERHVVPGLLQTANYARAMLEFWFDFLEIRNDLDEALTARMARQPVLYNPGKTFAIILEEAVLYTRFGVSETLAEQLDRLLSVTGMPNVSLGIVPRTAERQVVGQVSFWIFDDKAVALETPTASIEVTTHKKWACTPGPSRVEESLDATGSELGEGDHRSEWHCRVWACGVRVAVEVGCGAASVVVGVHAPQGTDPAASDRDGPRNLDHVVSSGAVVR